MKNNILNIWRIRMPKFDAESYNNISRKRKRSENKSPFEISQGSFGAFELLVEVILDTAFAFILNLFPEIDTYCTENFKMKFAQESTFRN